MTPLPFFRRTPRPEPSPQPQIHEVTEASAALDAVLGGLDGSRKWQILDLGPAVQTNVEFFSGFPCRLTIADLAREVSGAPAGTVEEALDRALRLQLPADAAFDLVLIWDLLNYLPPTSLQSLAAALRPRCRPDTVLVALIWNRPEIPGLPLRFRILEPGRISHQGGSRSLRRAPGYREHDLERLLSGFRVERTYLLRSGLQEYLLRPA